VEVNTCGKIAQKNNGIKSGLSALVAGQISYSVPWSRIIKGTEMLLAINTHYCQASTASLTIDESLPQDGELLTCIYAADSRRVEQETTVELRNGQAVLLTVPAAGLRSLRVKAALETLPQLPTKAAVAGFNPDPPKTASMPIPQPPGFLNLIERFERSLARVLAALLGVVLTVGTAQLCLGTAEALWRMDQNWLGGGLLALLDQLLLILIGLEVLQNLAAYLRDHSIHTELVVLTALTAVARKVIVMPPGSDKDPMALVAAGIVIICLALAYTLLRTKR
jgi:uncharacterized membrane protein (DUF373 family)